MTIAFRAALALLLPATALAAQRDQTVPAVAKSLVVKVVTFRRDTGRRAGFGAGVVLGWNDSLTYIVTAAHTISFRPSGRPLTEPPDTLAARIMLNLQDSVGIPAALVAMARDNQLDLAVLSVRKVALDDQRRALIAMDRLGNVKQLGNGVAVWPLGCPAEACWQAPAEPDHVMAVDGRGILFQSSFVQVGSSGGALFNQWWEVVGMVTEDLTVRANAVPIDLIVKQLESWRVPVRLTSPSVPRGGYRTTIGLTLLAPTRSPFNPDPKRSLPSGRLTFARRPVSRLSWHIGVLRLAPENLGITAAVIGGGLHFSGRRFGLRFFGEVGAGRVQGRYDVGGFYQAEPSGNRYVPSYRHVEADGLGLGGGLTAEIIVLPRTALEITSGYWSFTLPENSPRLNNVFLGTGVRWAP